MTAGDEGEGDRDDDVAAVAPARRRRGGLLRKLGLLLFTTVLVLALLEAGFRIAGYRPIHDVYSRPEVFWREDPLLGWSLEPGAEGEFVGPRPFPVQFRTSVRINDQGIRGPAIEDLPAGGLRVLVTGDSQAAGFEVEERETYAALLEQRLGAELARPVQVVNAAVRGYGTDQSYLSYVDRLRVFEADVVIHHTTANDPDDNVTVHRMSRWYGKPAFVVTDDGALQLVGTPVPRYPACSAQRVDEAGAVRRVDTFRQRAMCVVQTNLTDRSAFFSFVTAVLRQHPDLLRSIYGLGRTDAPVPSAPPQTAPPEVSAPSAAPSVPDDPAPPTPGPTAAETATTAPPPDAEPVPRELDRERGLTSRLIEELAVRVREDGAQLVVVGTTADLAQLDLRAVAAGGAPIVDIEPALAATGREVRIPNDGHLNVTGHAVVADVLALAVAELLR